MDKPAIYASLVHAAKTDDPRHGAFSARTREQPTAINKHLIFFDLEWVKVADEAVAASLDCRRPLAHYRHYLEQKRAWRPHYLSEPEEKILEEKAITGRGAFVRLFDETRGLHPVSLQAGPQDGAAQPAADQRQALRPRSQGSQGGGGRADQGLAGKRPAADVHLQQPRPRTSQRLRPAPLRRSDGAAPSGQRNQARDGAMP